MAERRVGSCACGHEWALHDAWGCAAFLGAFPETRGERRYCACRVPLGATPAPPAPSAPAEPIAELAG